MLKNIIQILITLIGMLLLSGCSVDVKVNNPLNENEIISYAQENIYRKTGDNVTVKIVSKEKMIICAVPFLDASCIYRQKLKNVYSYKLEITSKENPNIIATGTYKDGYIIYDDEYSNGEKIVGNYFDDNYIKIKGNNLVKNEFINILNEKFDGHYLYENDNNYSTHDIFINSSNYDDINNLLINFKDIIIKYRNYTYSSYNVYIYKDENIFNNIDYKLCNDVGVKNGKETIEKCAGKQAVRIGSSNEFNYDLFISNGASSAEIDNEYIDYNMFEYLVFWYQAGSSSFVGANSPKLQIFGVK